MLQRHDAARTTALMQTFGIAVSPELVLLSEPLELLSESDEDESESEDEEESDELELFCLRLFRGAAAPCSLGCSSASTSLGSMNFGRNCIHETTLSGVWHALQVKAFEIKNVAMFKDVVSRTQRQCSCSLLWDSEAAVSVLVSPCTRLHLCTGMSSDPVANTFDTEHLRLKPRQQVHASAGKLLLCTCNSSRATKCSLMRTTKLTPLLPCMWELPLPKILMIALQAFRSASSYALMAEMDRVRNVMTATFIYYRHFELQLSFIHTGS